MGKETHSNVIVLISLQSDSVNLWWTFWSRKS